MPETVFPADHDPFPPGL